MKKNEEYSSTELINISYALLDFARAAENIDNMLADAVSSGVESGRMLGMIEAYDYLMQKGHKKAADVLRLHIEDAYPEPPAAKA